MARSKKRAQRQEELPEDDIDRFANEHLAFDDDVDSDEEDSEMDNMEADDLNLPSSEEDDYDDDDEEEEDEEDEEDKAAELKRMHKKELRKLGFRPDESDEEEAKGHGDDDDEGIPSTKWGRRKKVFYVDESDVDSSDEETRQLEEEEIRKLEKSKLSRLNQGMFDDVVSSLMKQKKSSKSKSAEVALEKEGGFANGGADDMEDVNDDDDDDFDVTSAQKHKINRAIDKLTDKEKFAIVKKDAPELLALIEELREKLKVVRENVQPVMQKVRSNELPTSQGVSYLEMKFHLLLMYCVHICFYLLLKAKGRSIKDHPVVERLFTYRTFIERLRPLDAKLKTKIDKLLKIANEGELSKDDPANMKPSLETFLGRATAAKVQDVEMENDEEDDEEVEEGESEDFSDDGEEETEANGIYRAPKLNSVKFTDDVESRASKRQKRQDERDRKRAARSEMMKYIQEEYSNAPMQEYADLMGTGEDVMDEEERKREQLEEDMFKRLNYSAKRERRVEAKKKKKFVDELQKLADFQDLAPLQQNKPSQLMVDTPDSLYRKKKVRNIIRGLQAEKQEKQKDSADFQYGLNKRHPPQQRKQPPVQSIEEQDAMYIAAKQLAKKQKMERKRDRVAKASVGRIPRVQVDDEDIGKRSVTKQILKNRGLTKNRPKDTKISKTKLRKKFKTAVQKHYSQVPRPMDKPTNYGGEKRGVSGHVVRSTLLT